MSAKKGKTPETVAAASRAKNEELEGASSDIVSERHRKYALEAREWTGENDGAWMYMLATAGCYVLQGRKFGMQELAEQVRRRDFSDIRGEATRLNNNLVPPLARLLMREMPECAPLMETRTSAYDGLLG